LALFWARQAGPYRAIWRELEGYPLRLLLTVSLACLVSMPAFAADELARMKAEAARTTITRDDWGIAHVHGKSDADAVFAMAYAQAEDDFNRVETNYVTNLGRSAEAPLHQGGGEKAIWADLRQKLFLDPVFLRANYAKSPAWLKALMTGWADGLNYYLLTHPAVKPKVIMHFEPWMALSFTEGSIGGDIERIAPAGLEAFYGKTRAAFVQTPDLKFREPGGSNGIVIAPKDSASGHALLLINPHTSFFFRSELQMTSDEGLNAYGAVTWGQPFIYQGFNEHAGFMHTTSTLDAVDEFAETVTQKNGKYFYRHGNEERPMTVKRVTVFYRAADGSMAKRVFTTYATHHGPIVREEGGRWISFAMMNKPVEALEQSWLRTKQSDYASYLKVAALAANSSNDTLFADAKGEIALLLPQFNPKRDNRFDYTKPVDGSDPAADWQGMTPLEDNPHIVNPPLGWIYNTNDGPWWGAGPDSPRQADYPKYMDSLGENARGWHATGLLTAKRNLTLESLVSEVAFDSYLPAFAKLIPFLAKDYDTAPDPKLAQQVALLKDWDYRWSDHSLPTSLAVFWGEALWDKCAAAAKAAHMQVLDYMIANATGAQRLSALAEASARLQQDFGNWRTPWGEINRFQRNDASIVQTFDDAKPSVPVPFTSSQWGSLASFGARRYPGTKRYYGTSGNSFVAAVEFGPRVRAVAVTAGGESGDPASPHFFDQTIRYARGLLRPVYFWPDELKGHVARIYHPGE
jgi:acyl-homoserine-lactone acylase